MKLLFGERTVPALKVNGEKITGSRAILRRLDELRPEPALLPEDPAERARVEEAEAWGDDVLQGLVRRVLWPTFKAHPEAMATFSDGSKLPPIPVPVLKLIAPVATRIEMKANEASPATYPGDLRSLPETARPDRRLDRRRRHSAASSPTPPTCRSRRACAC